jgi:hypothetical protein
MFTKYQSVTPWRIGSLANMDSWCHVASGDELLRQRQAVTAGYLRFRVRSSGLGFKGPGLRVKLFESGSRIKGL